MHTLPSEAKICPVHKEKNWDTHPIGKKRSGIHWIRKKIFLGYTLAKRLMCHWLSLTAVSVPNVTEECVHSAKIK